MAPRTKKAAPKKAAPKKSESEGEISLSSPLIPGAQIIATAKGLEPSTDARVLIEGPSGSTRQHLRTNPDGLVQVFLHGPKAGDHKVSVEAGSSKASAEFHIG